MTDEVLWKQLSHPRLVYRDKRPVAVILDIDTYEELLERLEQIEDLRALGELRAEPVETMSFDDYRQQRRSKTRE